MGVKYLPLVIGEVVIVIAKPAATDVTNTRAGPSCQL